MRVNIAVRRELGIPLTTQVHDQIVAAISKGDLRPGDRLPTIRQLADFLELNRNTIAQVYRTLEQEGYVVTRGGGGTAIADTSATRVAVRTQELHLLIRKALQAADQKGFSAREFGEVALYESAQWQALRHAAFLVVDEYQGELDYLCRVVRHLLPGAVVYGALLTEIGVAPASNEVKSWTEIDFALVPFYCLEKARSTLSALGIPVIAAGIGPSVAALRLVAAEVSGKDVAIVCTEVSGPPYMERALRHAGVEFARVRHAPLGVAGFDSIIDSSDIVIASEGSIDVLGNQVRGKPTLMFSTLLGEDTLAAVHRYAETISRSAERDTPG